MERRRLGSVGRKCQEHRGPKKREVRSRKIVPLHPPIFPCYCVKMFARTNGRKSDTLDATFSYPETSKSGLAKVESTNARSALITDQVEIKGTLAFDGNLEFNGTFEGEMISQGTLSIGPEAVIKAEIHAAKVVIKGKVQGNITATESIELCDQAELFGDVRTAKFIVAETATFRGRSDPIEGKAAAPEFSPVFRRLTPKPTK